MDWIKMHKKVMRMQRLNKYMQLQKKIQQKKIKQQRKFLPIYMQISLNFSPGLMFVLGFYEILAGRY